MIMNKKIILSTIAISFLVTAIFIVPNIIEYPENVDAATRAGQFTGYLLSYYLISLLAASINSLILATMHFYATKNNPKRKYKNYLDYFVIYLIISIPFYIFYIAKRFNF